MDDDLCLSPSPGLPSLTRREVGDRGARSSEDDADEDDEEEEALECAGDMLGRTGTSMGEDPFLVAARSGSGEVGI